MITSILSFFLFGLWILAGVTIADRYYPATTTTRNLIGSSVVVLSALAIHYTLGFSIRGMQ